MITEQNPLTAPTPAAVLYGDTLVVFEGHRRLLWDRPGPGRWRPVGLWPGPAEAAALAARLASGHNVLVVLGRDRQSVPLLAEELAAAPAEVRWLAAAGPGTAEPYDVRIPFLDWLPPAERLRGLELLAQGAELVRSTPAALLPALLADTVGPTRSPVRFVLCTRAAGPGEEHIAGAAARLFGHP
ncbi:hypothetical protein ACT1U9_04840 [Streptomyces sp. BR1]|uniref:hypothetical protein n=1 Tax=Streptomyces sp. BR1 TaxID=1592323 RepID=UPI00402B4528